MSRLRFLGLVVLAHLVCNSNASIAGAPSGATARELPDIVAPLLEAVVNIAVLKHPGSDPSDPPDRVLPDRAFGSGFVISEDGYVVTNHHVVDGGYLVTVSLVDGSVFPATVIATMRRPDLALLKIDAGRPLAHVRFGDSDGLRIGETVIAIGNPLGLSSSVSAGIVSALNRDVDVTMIDDFIQTDAAINHGNSGGPLFSAKGEVVGVNWAIYAPGQQSGSAGLGLAIPANDAAWVIDQMRRFGRVRVGFAGLRLQQMTPEIQAVLGLESRSGGVVSGVLPGAPAAIAGVRDGDAVLAVNGRKPRDVRALLRDLGQNAPGSKVTLTIWRDRHSLDLDLVLANWPQNIFDPVGPQPDHKEARGTTVADLGLHLMAADADALRGSAFHAGQPSVLISGVSAGSPASDMRLNPGDLILRVKDDVVATPDEVWARLKAARSEGLDQVKMLVESRGAPRWIVVPLRGH
jgi:serine protease Do